MLVWKNFKAFIKNKPVIFIVLCICFVTIITGSFFVFNNYRDNYNKINNLDSYLGTRCVIALSNESWNFSEIEVSSKNILKKYEKQIISVNYILDENATLFASTKPKILLSRMMSGYSEFSYSENEIVLYQTLLGQINYHEFKNIDGTENIGYGDFVKTPNEKIYKVKGLNSSQIDFLGEPLGCSVVNLNSVDETDKIYGVFFVLDIYQKPFMNKWKRTIELELNSKTLVMSELNAPLKLVQNTYLIIFLLLFIFSFTTMKFALNYLINLRCRQWSILRINGFSNKLCIRNFYLEILLYLLCWIAVSLIIFVSFSYGLNFNFMKITDYLIVILLNIIFVSCFYYMRLRKMSKLTPIEQYKAGL